MSVLNGPGEGTWSVFAEKVVKERDAFRAEVERLRALLGEVQGGRMRRAEKIVAKDCRCERCVWCALRRSEAEVARLTAELGESVESTAYWRERVATLEAEVARLKAQDKLRVEGYYALNDVCAKMHAADTALLREVEWNGPHATCPLCGGQSAIGHHSRCRIAARLKEDAWHES